MVQQNGAGQVDRGQLDTDQEAIISLPNTQHQFIFGPPGSGKTNLLLLKASQLWLDGKKNLQFIVLTRGLREYIAGGSENYDFEATNVQTFFSFMMRFLRDEDVKFRLVHDYDTDRATLLKLCQNQLSRRKLKAVYDALIIDEAQDCAPDEVELFSKVSELLVLSADPRQKIYKRPPVIDMWNDVIPPECRHYLKYHYRNGHEICKLADYIMPLEESEQLLPSSRYDERRLPSVVRVEELDNLEDQIEILEEQIPGELRAYPDEMVGVMCPTNDVLKRAIQLLKQGPLHDLCQYHINQGDGYESFDPKKPVIVCNIYGGKGLEFRTLHLIEADEMKRLPNVRNVAFTAVTRAKTSLNVYHSGALPPLLASAINKLQAPRPQTNLSKLFKSRSNVE